LICDASGFFFVGSGFFFVISHFFIILFWLVLAFSIDIQLAQLSLFGQSYRTMPDQVDFLLSDWSVSLPCGSRSDLPSGNSRDLSPTPTTLQLHTIKRPSGHFCTCGKVENDCIIFHKMAPARKDATRKYVTTACDACRQSKVKVGNRFPGLPMKVAAIFLQGTQLIRVCKTV
jgi:hypothetical protein